MSFVFHASIPYKFL